MGLTFGRLLLKKWIEEQDDDVLLYAKYIESLGLKNISPYKVLIPHYRRRDNIPPKELWKNIATTLKVADQISTNLKAEVRPFLSAYRSPDYRGSLGNKPRPATQMNKSVRVMFDGASPYEVAAEARKLRSEGLFKGTVGEYRSFVYIDSRGYNATW